MFVLLEPQLSERYNNNNNNYNIDSRMYLNLSKSIQSAAELKFEAYCQWALFNVQIITLLFFVVIYCRPTEVHYFILLYLYELKF